MFANLIKWIKGLFGKTPQTTDLELDNNVKFAENYNDNAGINIAAMACNKISGIVVNESKAYVCADSEEDIHTPRIDLLDKLVSNFVKKKWKKATADTAGNGGMFIIPCLNNGIISEDVIPQNRVIINKYFNDKITDMTIIVDTVTINDNKYWLLRDMSLNNGIYTEKYKVIKDDIIGREVDIGTVSKWENVRPITPEGKGIQSDRLLMAFMKCPTSSKNQTTAYGVPITYGLDDIIANIKTLMKDFCLEYKNKRVFVGLDDLMLDENNEIPEKGLFKKFMVGARDTQFWELYDPPFRVEGYIQALDYWYKMFERGIGVSEGFFTQPKAAATTATEVKSKNYDTFIIQSEFRTAWEYALEDLVYSYNAIANVFGITPPSPYKLNFDWSYDLIENTDVAFNQLLQAESISVIDKVEIRQFIKPSETYDESKLKIDQMEAETQPQEEIIV